MDNLTPMFRQYREIKQEHQEVILLFRLGDFYEMFGEDAELAAKELDLTLTSREMGKGRRMPMCGVPYHAVDRYLARLIAKGYKAAICDQVEDAKQTKTLVKREVTRIITPGTVVEDHLLDRGQANYLVSIFPRADGIGIAAADSSTGEFMVTELAGDELRTQVMDELSRLQPAECLLPKGHTDALLEASIVAAYPGRVTLLDDPSGIDTAAELLNRHFGTANLRGFGCEDLPLAIEAAAGLLQYLRATQKSALAQIQRLVTYYRSEFMILDATTRRNLELTRSLHDGSRAHTLLDTIDRTTTPMGARLLHSWLVAPLLEVEAIRARHDAVATFREQGLLRQDLRDLLRQVHDLERLVGRAATGTANARDLVAMRSSLQIIPQIAEAVVGCEVLSTIAGALDPLPELRELLETSIADDPPPGLRDGGLIRDGYHAELDELRRLGTEGKDWIARLEQQERERTGIKSLKVGFNQVFGYYLEVSRPNLSLVPADYIRKQTMVNAERFITPDLKEWEARVLGAQDRIITLEADLFAAVRQQVAAEAARIQATARAVAQLDVLAGLAQVAAENDYHRPAVDADDVLEVHGGRHPVVERASLGERFIPNDTTLDCRENQLLIITGPNMAGKSTYLRQVALLVVLAQMGSFVPAESARIGVVDRIFTRVGASDDLATGQSTFMVEMTETAQILHHATQRSLIVLDEVGRGTSTFDGLSIAWAVVEHLHNHPRLGAKTLFATHYHQLNELERSLPRVKNYRIAVKEEGDRIIFLRKIIPGGTDRSYGIQVARLAGLPQEVIERAKEVLWALEQEDQRGVLPAATESNPQTQFTLFEARANPVIDEIRGLDVTQLTPLDALNKLAEMQDKVKKQ